MTGPPPGRATAGHGTRETRKNVSVLFVDIVGSTAIAERLDPEALRTLLDSYFERCSRAVRDHGGAVEKFIGDAVLAVFGTVVSHEDDALRAVRSASDTRAALADLNADLVTRGQDTLAIRCGICSGEVVVLSAPDGGFRVVGDAVNTASRLQGAAAPGEILIDAATASMVRNLVAIEPTQPMTLKGKAGPVRAWRVLAATTPAALPPARPTVPTVNRGEELELLRQAYRMATSRPQVCQVTVLGEPGIGKSRLVRDFVSEVTQAASAAGAAVPVVLAGHCSAYGHGITYLPLAEVARSWPGGWPVLERLLRADAGSGAAAADRLATIVRDTASPPAPGAPGTARQPGDSAGVEELAWAARCMVEIAARGSPVIVVWEDLHWAEQTLLDLIDDISTWLTDLPVLQVCVARPGLLAARPGWGGGKPCAVALDVPPLTTEQSAELIGALASRAGPGPDGTQSHGTQPHGTPAAAESDRLGAGAVSAHSADGYARAVATCDGNPLFAELLCETLADGAAGTAAGTAAGGPAGGPAGGGAVPPTIHALLGARLDQLPDGERDILERAALIGREFGWEQLRALCAADRLSPADAQSALSSLIRRRVLQHGRAPGSFRFAQALLRDAAYALTTKARRERWHLAAADWLSERRDPAASGAAGGGTSGGTGGGTGGAAIDASVAMACHVEAACKIRRELVPGLTELPAQAAQAARALAGAGEQALARKDLPAAAGLLERARDLLPAGDPGCVRLMLHLADACIGMWDGQRALTALMALRAALGSDGFDRLTCEVAELTVKWRLRIGDQALLRSRSAEIAAGLAESDAPGDELTRCRLYQLLAYLDFAAERAGDATASLRRGLSSALALGDAYEEERILCAICELAQWSPDPVGDGLAVCDELAVRFSANRALLHPVLLTRARLSAMAGDFPAARQAVETTRQHASDLHLDMAAAATCEVSGFIESLSGAFDLAAARFGEAEAVLRQRGQAQEASTMRAARARALFERGSPADAAAAIAGLGTGTDLRTEVMLTSLRARLAGGPRGTGLARRAVTMALATQDPCLHGDAWRDLAVVLAEAGSLEDAAAAAGQATARYLEKGAVLLAARVPDFRSRITQMRRRGRPDER